MSRVRSKSETHFVTLYAYIISEKKSLCDENNVTQGLFPQPTFTILQTS